MLTFTISISSIRANHAPALLRLLNSFWGLRKVIQTFLWSELISAEFSLPWSWCRHCPHAGNRNVTLSDLFLVDFFLTSIPLHLQSCFIEKGITASSVLGWDGHRNHKTIIILSLVPVTQQWWQWVCEGLSGYQALDMNDWLALCLMHSMWQILPFPPI